MEPERKFEIVATQVVGLGGFGALLYGIHMVDVAAAYISAGALCLVWAIFKSSRPR